MGRNTHISYVNGLGPRTATFRFKDLTVADTLHSSQELRAQPVLNTCPMLRKRYISQSALKRRLLLATWVCCRPRQEETVTPCQRTGTLDM